MNEKVVFVASLKDPLLLFSAEYQSNFKILQSLLAQNLKEMRQQLVLVLERMSGLCYLVKNSLQNITHLAILLTIIQVITFLT